MGVAFIPTKAPSPKCRRQEGHGPMVQSDQCRRRGPCLQARCRRGSRYRLERSCVRQWIAATSLVLCSCTEPASSAAAGADDRRAGRDESCCGSVRHFISERVQRRRRGGAFLRSMRRSRRIPAVLSFVCDRCGRRRVPTVLFARLAIDAPLRRAFCSSASAAGIVWQRDSAAEFGELPSYEMIQSNKLPAIGVYSPTDQSSTKTREKGL